ncbi:response regulator [Methanohalophilus profundi]|uniref:response regulator n=1 Tax=Methanohalophilus profundi TaxID=2138083 RepID=UPI00101B5CC8|nr:response regulator [Methanohalophilus profundi]
MLKEDSIILIIDDEPDIIELLEIFLENFKTISSSSPIEGLKLAKTEHPDLIILDVMMPQMNGYELCREIKQNSSTKNIPVFMYSALFDSSDIKKGLQAGADEYLKKPIHPCELETKVQETLLKKKAFECRGPIDGPILQR